MEMVGHGAVHRHGQRVKSGPRGQHTHQEAFSDSQFSVDVARPDQRRVAFRGTFTVSNQTPNTGRS
jgi:hypothetical protein